LILTSALESAEDVIRTARELNPAIHVLARTVYLRDVDAIQKAGAQAVFSGEGEVAFALTEAILHRLGATAEQIDRERARVHTDLFGGEAASSGSIAGDEPPDAERRGGHEQQDRGDHQR
jgi:CPA2 family monovalent cation:H+ antiporter-2